MNDSQGVFDFPFLSTMQSYEPLSLNMGRIERVGQFNAASSSSASSASPASRQKSCNACVRGKRRCDKTAPRCTRCAAKGLDCVYQRVPPGSSPSSVTLAGSGADARLSDADMACVVGAADPDLPDDFEMDMGGFDVSVSEMSGGGGQHGSSTSATTTTATTSPDSLALDPNLEFSIVDLLGNGSGSGDAGDSGSSLSGLWGLPGFSEPKADFPSLMVPPQPYNQQNQAIRDVAILEDHRSARKCMSIDPLLVHDPRSNIGFMVETLTNMHVGFVQSRAMPFIHPRLYHLNVPKTMMAAFCGASTYMTRTPSTRAWAFKAVQDATAEVHREGALAVTPLDKIARLHALLVLESIRFFDGDLGLRYASEREVGKLSEWSIEMLEVLDELDCREAAMSRDQPPATWDSWILRESARRSTTIGMAFQCFTSIMRSETPDGTLISQNIPYTASRHLWDASTSVEFFRAWREQPQWTIVNFDYKDFWMYARPEDMDEFTKMMLTVQASPDAVDHFMQGDTSIPV